VALVGDCVVSAVRFIGTDRAAEWSGVELRGLESGEKLGWWRLVAAGSGFPSSMWSGRTGENKIVHTRPSVVE
jgi:alkylated DNA nucleotide flippase Atl1